MTDRERYRELIEKARKYYEGDVPELKNIFTGSELFDFEWCPGLDKEINMWTYWQGGKRENSNMSAEILLVGQDWGSCNDKDCFYKSYVGEVAPKTEAYVQSIFSNKNNKTDSNLIELFKVLGEKYHADIPNPRLFFTNLCLGYRSIPQISGGDVSAQMRHDSIYLKELISILKPRVVICIGASTYISAITGLLDKDGLEQYKDQLKQLGSSFNSALDDGKNHIHISSGGLDYEIFTVAHSGFMGANNRKRYSEKYKNLPDSLAVMKEDWKLIKKYLQN
ncbi:MAG: hypothetical protein K5989_11295 [Lachnospiraceae bacterium]|nr:hypothetical protein [Lachnospiraceae bacterium]